MENRTNQGIAVVAVGVLLVVLSSFTPSPWTVVLSVVGAIVAVVGAVLVYRARRPG